MVYYSATILRHSFTFSRPTPTKTPEFSPGSIAATSVVERDDKQSKPGGKAGRSGISGRSIRRANSVGSCTQPTALSVIIRCRPPQFLPRSAVSFAQNHPFQDNKPNSSSGVHHGPHGTRSRFRELLNRECWSDLYHMWLNGFNRKHYDMKCLLQTIVLS